MTLASKISLGYIYYIRDSNGTEPNGNDLVE
jgi:hypothetical protein